MLPTILLFAFGGVLAICSSIDKDAPGAGHVFTFGVGLMALAFGISFFVI